MSEHVEKVPTYDIPSAIKGTTIITPELYAQLYQRSIQDPEEFWAEQADKFVTWFKKWDKILEWDFHRPILNGLSVETECFVQLP